MILLCYGTRPEWIKIKPLVKSFEGKIPFRVLFTGQHADISGGWYHDKLKITEGVNRLDSIFSSVMNNIDFDEVSAVLVQGDTATCLAVGLSAFNHKVPVIHLEAGLRTYDLEHPYPEEGYRQMLSRITNIHLCPTKIAKTHLLRDSVGGDIHVVGNTVLDNLVGIESSYGDEVLVTIHRRENHNKIDDWMRELDKLDENVTVIRHPNPAVMNAVDKLKNVNVIDPLPHDEMVKRIANCKFLITDSGGLQEEGSFFNKKIIICRETTERPEALEHHGVLCSKPENLLDIVESVKNDYIVEKPCPFGDGQSSIKIMEILCRAQQLHFV
jgi:UDP-N-acetylglucosamine 2-epimerase (non-hydrolysing)